MKLKLDENLGPAGRDLLAAEGHDVMTVVEQDLSGASDESLYAVCRDEGRVLVTLDHDFGHVLGFPPSATAGIGVLELRGRLSPKAIMARLTELAALLQVQPIDRDLWIIEAGRLRIHQWDGD